MVNIIKQQQEDEAAKANNMKWFRLAFGERVELCQQLYGVRLDSS